MSDHNATLLDIMANILMALTGVELVVMTVGYCTNGHFLFKRDHQKSTANILAVEREFCNAFVDNNRCPDSSNLRFFGSNSKTDSRSEPGLSSDCDLKLRYFI